MRIVSWNMNHWSRSPDARQKAWNYLRHGLHADVALVQEGTPPAGFDSVYRPLHDTNPHYQWGSSVVLLAPGIQLRARPRVPLAAWDFDGRTAGAIPESHPGACAVSDVLDTTGQTLFTAVSFYGQWEAVSGRSRCYACAKVHRMLSDLTGLLARARRESLILAGDFNLTTQTAYEGQTRAEIEGAWAAFARIRAWGLVECVAHTAATRPRLAGCTCGQAHSCGHVQTYRNRNQRESRPLQLDYAFVSEPLLASLRTCRVVDDEDAWALSDHCPILLELSSHDATS